MSGHGYAVVYAELFGDDVDTCDGRSRRWNVSTAMGGCDGCRRWAADRVRRSEMRAAYRRKSGRWR